MSRDNCKPAIPQLLYSIEVGGFHANYTGNYRPPVWFTVYFQHTTSSQNSNTFFQMWVDESNEPTIRKHDSENLTIRNVRVSVQISFDINRGDDHVGSSIYESGQIWIRAVS